MQVYIQSQKLLILIEVLSFQETPFQVLELT